MYYETSATQKILKMKKRVRAVSGGTRASKTISILLSLIGHAQSDTEPTLTSIVSESIPHLKKGAMRDFQDILKKHNYWKEQRWNATDRIYTFETGSQIEFFSADVPSKLRGAGRDRLYMNECNNLPYESYLQLEMRTKEFVYLDWNPTAEFWYYTELEGNDDVEFITLTYKDNEALDERIVKSIESKKDNVGWWRVYGLGLLGEAEGRIYTGWKTIDEIPHEARLVRTGLDFGYTNDPTAAIDIYEYNGGYILDERIYRKGLSNKQIADLLDADVLVFADGAEPKSIDEIASYGITITGAEKGRGSINQGIQFIQEQKISVTKRSLNILKEYRNYLWKVDKRTGRGLNIPEDIFNHAMDALRYGLSSDIKKKKDNTQKNRFAHTRARKQKYRKKARMGV